MTYREAVYLCSPLRGTQAQLDAYPNRDTLYEMNSARAMRRCRELAMDGLAPFAPHLYCPRFLDDRLPREREAGIEIGRAFLGRCSRVLVDSTDGISGGMRLEIAEAETLHIPIVYRWR